MPNSETGKKREVQGGGRPTIPPGYHRGSYSLSHMGELPAPGWASGADLKVDVTAAHSWLAEVRDEEA